MNAINLILTVCAVASPATCEERNLVFSSDFSLRQCAMAAQPTLRNGLANIRIGPRSGGAANIRTPRKKSDIGDVTTAD